MKREEELRPEAPLPEGDCDNDYGNEEDVRELQPGAKGLTPVKPETWLPTPHFPETTSTTITTTTTRPGT